MGLFEEILALCIAISITCYTGHILIQKDINSCKFFLKAMPEREKNG